MLRQFVKKLPVYHQTETQKQFFAATFDQLFNPSEVEPAQGFIGRRSGGTFDVNDDVYLSEPTQDRLNYQLEPIAYSTDSETLEDSNHVFYEDLINKLRFYGSNVENHDRLFSDKYYSFAPPIDMDKYVNFGNYVWIDEDITPVFIRFGGSRRLDGVLQANISAAGTGYSVNDVLTVIGGVRELSAQFTVTAIGGGGEVTEIEITEAGRYIDETFPTNPASVTGGTGTGATFNLLYELVGGFEYIIANNIVGQEQFNTNDVAGLSPVNFQFTSGVRVNFEGSLDFPDTYYVGGVGTSIDLVGPITTQTPDTVTSSEPWDNVDVSEEWDNFIWASSTIEATDPEKNHITIERGSCDGNVWSRTNRWVHREAIDAVQKIGQIIDTVIVDGGIGYQVGETLDITGDGTGGVLEITGVDGFGTITNVAIIDRGSGYKIASVDETGVFVNFIQVPWDEFPLGPNSQWDSIAWDRETAASGTGALIDITLASAIDKTNRAERPIIEFVKDLELYNHGTKYVGEVDLAAEDVLPSDIIGQSSFILDGIALTNGMKIIFQTGDATITQLLWDEDPNAGPGSMSVWDSGPWAVQGVPEAVTKFVWQVSGVGTAITLEKFDLATNTADPAAPAAEFGDTVLVTNGVQFAGVPFYQGEDEFLGVTWLEGQSTAQANTPPKFMAYDYRAIPLNDTLEFPDNDFEGNEIFSYRIYNGEDVDENEIVSFDNVLEFETIRKNLGQVGDILFENDLETVRTTYNTPSGRVEIPGYYFYRKLNACGPAPAADEKEYFTNWLESEVTDKQRYVERFLTDSSTETVFRLGVVPVDEDILVEVDGNRLGVDEFTYDAARNAVVLNVAPDPETIVETFTYTYDRVDSTAVGYFEVPNGLEKNPTNEEVIVQSWNDFVNHFVSIIENQDDFVGSAFGVNNNYRDSAKDGSVGQYILQNQSPLLKAMLSMSSDELDLVESMRFASREYSRFKNKLLNTLAQLLNEGYTPFNQSDPIVVNQWLDEALRRIIQSREYKSAFEDSYMISWTNVFEEETIVGNSVSQTLTILNFVDLEDRRNSIYIYKNGELLVKDRDYTIVNLNPIQIYFEEVPLIGDDIIARLYTKSSPAHIPATPVKLGITQATPPRIEIDSTYRTPTEVIVGHDGSKTPTYGDLRDDILLEYEKRVYNGLQDKFIGNYEPALIIEDVAPNAFRSTRWLRDEYENILRQSFFKWAMVQSVDYRTNDTYDAGDPWTWNYSSLTAIDGNPMPGYWRGIFDYYYGTQTPHLTPWEMLGFSVQPNYWETVYGNDYGATNTSMWDDIESGIIRNASFEIARTDERFARPGLSSYLPVTNAGTLKATPLECINHLGTVTPDDAADIWSFGDWAPVEYAWRTSESFDFAIAETLFLTKPGAFGERLFNAENFLVTPANEDQFVTERDGIFKRIGNSILTVHGESSGGDTVLNTGYQVWITSYLKMLGRSVGVEFGDKVRNLNVKLGHKMAGFTDRDSTRLYVEGVSVSAKTPNLLVPVENVDVRLFTGAPVKEYFYGGVLIQGTDTGGFRIFGYDILKNIFSYNERKASPKDRNINIAGQPEAFVDYESGRIYDAGKIVRLNGQFYRALVTHESTKFIPENWQKLSKLPTKGGINVTYKPQGSGKILSLEYGEELKTPQEVFDFLIGYGEYLTQQGWSFENIDTQSNTVENWLNAGKEFLFWAATNWEPGNVIALSPAAGTTVLDVKEGYPMPVEKIINSVYSILDQGGMAIDPSNTKVRRNDRRIEVIPTLNGQEIYSLRVNTAETESIVTIDNVTEFNDVIYDPLLGTRQERLFFNGRRTSDWTGKLEAAGFIITENGLLPNFENLVDSVRFYHDTERDIYSPELEAVARHLTGYVERDYLNGLDILGDAQYNFYKGMIRQKGTKESIAKLERSDVVTALQDELVVHEEWALKVGEFGGVTNRGLVEVLIEPNLIKVDPQLVELSYEQSDISTSVVDRVEIVSSGAVYTTPPTITLPSSISGGTAATATSVLNTDGTLKEIIVTDGGVYPTGEAPPVLIDTPIVGDFDENSDRAVAVMRRDIQTDIAGDDIITIDIDDNEHWITKPTGVATDIADSLWPTADEEVTNVPRAGYVNFEDVSHTVFDIVNLQSLWNLPKPPSNGSRVWTAKADNRDWAVYQLLESVAPITIRQYNTNDIDYSLFTVNEISVSLAGTGFSVDDELTVDISTVYVGVEVVEPSVVRITSVGGSGEVLSVETVDGGVYAIINNAITLPLNVPITKLLSSGFEIQIDTITPASAIPGLVVFDGPLPDAATAGIRYLMNKVVIGGVVYTYELVNGNFYILTLDGEPIDDETINLNDEFANTESMVLYNLRFEDKISEPVISDSLINLAWVDNAENGEWEVTEVASGVFGNPHRKHSTLIDTEKFQGAFIYEVDSKSTLVNLPIYDPYKGIFPGVADREIRHRSSRDPARYNRAMEELSDPRLYRPSMVFGADRVGELWWDTSTCAYPLYEQPATEAEIAASKTDADRSRDRYRRDYWGKLFPGSSIDVYEWTRSLEPPSEYEGDGTPRNLLDYVELQEWDPLIEEIRTFYYFWVKDVPVSPGTKNRKLSASEVARTIRNPRAQLYQWYSPISQSGFVFSGVEGAVTDSRNVFQINFRRLDNDNRRHIEWELGSETNDDYSPNRNLWNKMVDSLVGFTTPVTIGVSTVGGNAPTLDNFQNALPLVDDATKGYLIVPDPALSDLNKSGIRRRPLQTMFNNRSKALKIFVQVVNELLSDIRLRDENPNWNSALPTNNLWYWETWFEDGFSQDDLTPTRQVATVGLLSSITDAFPGEVIKVNDTQPSYYSWDPENEQFILIAKEEVRLVLKDEIYTNTKNITDSSELRAIVDALRNNIFSTGGRAGYNNRIFFSMLNYVFQEQEDLDWAFKTTYVTIEQEGKPITADRIFQADPYDNVLEYMLEVKPYQTKIRDYKVSRAIEVDDLLGSVEELDRTLRARLLYDRFTCSLSITEMRIAKSAAIADPSYDGYNTLWKDGVETEIRLGAAGRYVISQTDLLADILYIDSDQYEDFVPQNSYWDTIEWDSQGWDGSSGTNPIEIAAVAEINRLMCEEFRRYFDGVEANSASLVGTTSTEPWDSLGWDSVGWDANEDATDTEILDASLDGSFADIPPEDSFVGDGVQKEFILTTTVPTFLLFAQVFNTDGQAISTVLNVDYFFIGGRLVFVNPPANGYTVNVYTYLESGDFINPEANDRVTEEMVPLDPRENLVIVADTVDDPNTPTVSYSFRIHYDTLRTASYLRNDTPTMTTITAPVDYTDTTIAVADVTVLEEQPTTFDTPNIAWICNERIVFHGVDYTNNLLLGVQRGTNGTPLDRHDVSCKVFAGGPDQEIPNPEVYWVSPAVTNAYSGTDGIWRDNADGTAIFSDVADNAFAANVVPTDALVVDNTNASGTYNVNALLSSGSLTTVTITTPGTGYEVGDTIDITGAGSGTAEVGAIGTDGAVTAVTITDFGAGYAGASETMTAAGSGDGTFSATVVTNREALVVAHTAPIFTGVGRVAEANSIIWRIDKKNPGGLLASSTDAANFILLQQGDALPCCTNVFTATWTTVDDPAPSAFVMFGEGFFDSSPFYGPKGLQLDDGVVTMGTGPGVDGNLSNWGSLLGGLSTMTHVPSVDRYIATGYRDPDTNIGRLSYTDDFGLTWTDPSPTTITSGATTAILCRPSDERIVVGNTVGRIVQSDDGGLTWNPNDIFGGERIGKGFIDDNTNEFVLGWGSRFILRGNDSDELTTGFSTLTAFPGTTGSYQLQAMVRSEDDTSRIVAWQNGPAVTVAYSSDFGGTWTTATDQPPSAWRLNDMKYADGQFVGVGYTDESPIAPFVAISSDGITWTYISLASEFVGFDQSRMVGVAYHQGTWCLTGWRRTSLSYADKEGIIMTTTDFSTYNIIPVPEMRMISSVMGRQ